MSDPTGAGLDTLLAALEREHGFHVRSATPLAGGLVNRSLRLDTSAGELVLRLAAGRDAELVVDRRSEFEALSAAAGAGLAPQVIACDLARGLLLTRFEAPGAWTREQARSPAGVAAVARWFSALHRLPSPVALRAVDARATCAAYLAELAARPLGDRGRSRVAHEAEAAAGVLGAPRAPVFCHNDLHHLNIVGSLQRPRAIDWEYAGLGDARLDLAQFALAHDLDEGGRAALLAAYDGPDGPVPPAGLAAAIRLAAALNAAWLAVAVDPAG